MSLESAPASPAAPPDRRSNPMNRKGVIIFMTIAVFVVLTALMTLVFGGLPAWPVLIWFAASHIFFCVIIIRVKPFNGPYTQPLTDPDPADWPR